MTRDSTTGAAGAPDASTQGVTLCVPAHIAAPSHALVLREGPKPTRPRGRIPRVVRLLALAYHFQELLDTRIVETQAELAKLTPARVSQIMTLLGLAPDIQEEIFFLPPVTNGRPAITERHLRQILKRVV